ncbi:MAG: type II secretion system F family protein, partial [Gammaproteobacteria bacterium]
MEHVIFAGMVFVAVSLLATSLIVPAFGTEAQAAKRLRSRIRGVMDSHDPATAQLLRDRYLRDLSPLERSFEGLPGMQRLAEMIEQAGRKIPAYKVVLIALGLALAAGVLVGMVTHQSLFGLPAAAIAFGLPFMKILHERNQRLALFEEQLPEALNIMSRAMRAGHPFVETLKLVGEEMHDPIATEFRTAFTDLNYGMSTKAAFMGLLARIPSVSLMAVTTAVLVQRETGGNMAEVLDKIAAVVRGRFRFQRRVRTLSAEGRLSAWILSLVPFVLAGALWLSSPDYLP